MTITTILQINWNFINESIPIHLGTSETKAYTINGMRTVLYMTRKILLFAQRETSECTGGEEISVKWIVNKFVHLKSNFALLYNKGHNFWKNVSNRKIPQNWTFIESTLQDVFVYKAGAVSYFFLN